MVLLSIFFFGHEHDQGVAPDCELYSVISLLTGAGRRWKRGQGSGHTGRPATRLSWTIVSRSHTFSSHSTTLAPACQKPFKVYDFWSCDGGSADAKDVCVSGSRSVELCSLLFWSYPIILRAVPQRWRWCSSVLPSLWLWRLIRLIVCNSSLLGVRCLLFLFQRVMINDCAHSSGHCLHSQTFGIEQWEPLLFHVQFAWTAQLGCCFALLTPSCRTGRSAGSLVLVWFWMSVFSWNFYQSYYYLHSLLLLLWTLLYNRWITMLLSLNSLLSA